MRSFSPKVRNLLLAGSIAVVITAAGCTTATPYQPLAAATAAARGGYAEVQLAPERWQVTFTGNTLTSRETVEGYLLYRAAELSLEQGQDWFEIVERKMEHEVRQEPDPFYDPWWGYMRWRPYWHYYDRPYGWRYWYPYDGDPFFDMRQVEQFEASAEIVMHRGERPDGDGNIFDAREVIARIGSNIVRPK